MPRMQVRIVSDNADVAALRGAWLALEERPTDHDAAFFQSFGWCSVVSAARQRLSADRFEPLVAVVQDRQAVVAIWPLSVQRASGIRTVRNLDDPFGQLAGILCARAEWIEPCVAAILEHIRVLGLADAVCIDHVIEGSPLHCALIAAGARTNGTNEIVQVDMRQSPTFADYQRTRNAKSRKNLRNAMNRLRGAHGDIVETVVEDKPAIGGLIRQTFAGRLEWMKVNGKSTDAFRDAVFRPLVEGLDAAPELSLIGFQMQAFGRTIASQWGFVHGGRYYAYISSRDLDFDDFSPGRLHLGSVLAACKERRLDILELMAPAAPYKLMWSDRVMNIHDLSLPLTARGRVTLGVLEVAMPAMQSLARALPPGLKRRLARHVNKA